MSVVDINSKSRTSSLAAKLEWIISRFVRKRMNKHHY